MDFTTSSSQTSPRPRESLKPTKPSRFGQGLEGLDMVHQLRFYLLCACMFGDIDGGRYQHKSTQHTCDQ